jgi:hypothetical protein
MTITFAAARNREHPAIANALSPKVRLSPVNDNTGDICGNPAMRAALELFAAHGIGATQEACRMARSAATAGNLRDCRHWLSVCRMFDRRLADSWESRLGIARGA